MLLLLLLAVVFVPPAIHGYTYPSIGDDAAAHLENMDRIRAGEEPVMSYWGTAIVGYPLVWLADGLNVSNDAVYVWWNYAMIALAGIVIYLVFSSLVNKWAGFLASAMALFGTQGVMYLFNYGVMFDIVNMMIILPLWLWFTVKWLGKQRWGYAIGALASLSLFCVFHTSGEYMQYALEVVLLVYTTAWISAKGVASSILTPKVVLPSLVLMLTVSILLVSGITATPDAGERLAATGPWVATLDVEAISVPTFLFGVLGLIPIGLCILGAVVILKRGIEVPPNAQLLIVILAVLSAVLAGGAFVGSLSPDPSRQALDLVGVVAVLIAVIVGVAIEAENNRGYRGTGNADTEHGDMVRVQLGTESGG